MSAVLVTIQKLLQSTPVTDIVGTSVFPIKAPERVAYPYVIVNLAHGDDEQMLLGPAKLYFSRVQLDCLASSASASMILGDAVSSTLEDVVKENISGYMVDCMRDGVDITDYSDDRSAFRRAIGFHVFWTAAKGTLISPSP